MEEKKFTQSNPNSLKNLRPPWKKGESGNKGQKQGAKKKKDAFSQLFTVDDLMKAAKTVEGKRKQKLLEHFVDKAYEDNKVLVSLIKKFINDKNTQEILLGEFQVKVEGMTEDEIRAEIKRLEPSAS